MSPRFVLGGGGGNVPCVAEVVNRSLKADCTDFTHFYRIREEGGSGRPPLSVSIIIQACVARLWRV